MIEKMKELSESYDFFNPNKLDVREQSMLQIQKAFQNMQTSLFADGLIKSKEIL